MDNTLLTDEQKYYTTLDCQLNLPKSINLELTNYCNLQCDFCLNHKPGFREKGFISDDIFMKLISEISTDTLITLCGIGEPTLHKNFIRYLEELNRKDNPVFLVTNGQDLSDAIINSILTSNIKKVTISLDYFSAYEYKKNKNGDLKNVITTIEKLIQGRKEYQNKSLILQINMLAQRGNENQIAEAIGYFNNILDDSDFLYSRSIKDLAGQVNVNYIENYDPWYSLAKFKNSLSKKVDIKKYKVEDWIDFLEIQQPLKQRLVCRHPFLYSMILWDGRVVACCIDFNAQLVMGSLRENSIFEIWNGKQYKEFRESMLKLDFNDKKLCAYCDEWYKQK